MLSAMPREDQRVTALRQVSFFAGLAPSDLHALGQAATLQTLARHEVLFEADDPAPVLHVVDGQFKVSLYGLNGDETILNLLGPGELLGELSLFEGDARRSATATAVEPTTVLVLQRGVFRCFLQDHPEVAILLLGELSEQIRRLGQLVDDTYHLGLEQRLAKRLLDLAAANARVRGTSIDLSVPLTQAELASMLGATRESVNKILRSYSARGIVDAGRSRIRVLRIDALRRVAGEDVAAGAP